MDFFIERIRDILWAEEQQIQLFPTMMEKTTSKELVHIFGKHLKETEWHADRLIRVFSKTGRPVSTKRCEAMAGILREENEIVSQTKEDTFTRDAGLVMAAQKTEHYEIATYGTLVRLAGILELFEVAEILGKTLNEEVAADRALSEMAQNQINTTAGKEEK